MTIEEKLKNLILSRYHSIRDFTTYVGLPYTTLDSMFRRGVGNSSITNVLKVCKALGISMDALADGEIQPITRRVVVVKDAIDVEDVLEDTKDMFLHGGSVNLDGKPINKDSLESIIDAIDIGVEMAKKKRALITETTTEKKS